MIYPSMNSSRIVSHLKVRNFLLTILESLMKEVTLTFALTNSDEFPGVKIDFVVTRDEFFFLSYFIFPSILFVITSYMSFWIAKEAAPARVTLAILSILIAINFQTNIHKYVPQISYTTWISTFMLGI